MEKEGEEETTKEGEVRWEDGWTGSREGGQEGKGGGGGGGGGGGERERRRGLV